VVFLYLNSWFQLCFAAAHWESRVEPNQKKAMQERPRDTTAICKAIGQRNRDRLVVVMMVVAVSARHDQLQPRKAATQHDQIVANLCQLEH